MDDPLLTGVTMHVDAGESLQPEDSMVSGQRSVVAAAVSCANSLDAPAVQAWIDPSGGRREDRRQSWARGVHAPLLACRRDRPGSGRSESDRRYRVAAWREGVSDAGKLDFGEPLSSTRDDHSRLTGRRLSAVRVTPTFFAACWALDSASKWRPFDSGKR